MNPLLYPLPLDLSGESSCNRVIDEFHDLTDQQGLPYRVVVMDKGYFYTKDLNIVDGRGYTLQKKDYQCTMLNPVISKTTALTACAVIVITNKNIHPVLRITTQMVGGIHCKLTPAILEQTKGLLNNTRKVYWKNILNKPDKFNPNGHLHALWELFGFTPSVIQLRRMTVAQETILEKNLNNIFEDFRKDIKPIEDKFDQIDDSLERHIADENNPHRISVLDPEINLGNVLNADIATLEQARQMSGELLNVYATPLRVYNSIETNFLNQLNQHINDEANPHKDTAASVGTLTIQELNLLANSYYDKNTVVDSTERLGGDTFTTLFTAFRTNIPIKEIRSGLLTPNFFTIDAATVDSILVPVNNTGVPRWRSLADIFDKFASKSTGIIYLAGNYPPGSAAVNALNSQVGFSVPLGTIAVYRQIRDYSAHWVVYYDTNIAVLKQTGWSNY